MAVSQTQQDFWLSEKIKALRENNTFRGWLLKKTVNVFNFLEKNPEIFDKQEKNQVF